MIRSIIRMGNPILRNKNEDVELPFLKTSEFEAIINDLKDTMIHYGGIGIAAPQIGINLKIAIIDIKLNNQRYPEMGEFPFTVFVNPKLTIVDEKLQGYWEGCLSLPGLKGHVQRPRSIKVEYIDIQGNSQSLEAKGFIATVLQHELDHLFGKLYIDRISDTTKLSFNEEYQQFWVDDKTKDAE